MKQQATSLLLIFPILAASLAILPSAAAQGATVTEDFEDEAILADPSGDGYTFVKSTSSGKAVVADNAARTGTQSYFLDNYDGVFVFDDLSVNATGFDIWINKTLSSTSKTLSIQLQDCDGIDVTCGTGAGETFLLANVQFIGASKCIQVQASRNDLTGSSASGSNTACVGSDDDWVLVRAFIEGGSSGTWKVQLPEFLEQSEVSLNTSRVGDMRTLQVDPISSAHDWHLDDLSITGADTTVTGLPTVFPEGNQTGLTGLTGFAASAEGAAVLVRNGGTGVVTVLDPITLAAGASFNTNCLITDAVWIGINNLAYLDCDGGGAIESFNIESHGFGPPVVPSGCSEHQSTVRTTSVGNDDFFELRMPFVFDADFRIPLIDDSSGDCTLLWTMISPDINEGTVRLYEYTTTTLGGLDTVDTTFASGSVSPHQACYYAKQEAEDIEYRGGVAGSGMTPRVMSFTDFTNLGHPTLEGSPTVTDTLPSAYYDAGSIACGSGTDLVLVANGDELSAFNTTTNTEAWTVVLPATAESGGLDMTKNSEFYIVAHDDSFTVGHVSNGTAIVQGDSNETSSFVGIGIDATAQKAWVGYADGVYQFDLVNFTTGTPESPLLDDFTTDPDDDPEVGEGDVGGIVARAAEGTGISQSLIGGIFTFLLVAVDAGMLAAGAFLATRNAGLTIAAGFGGAALGLGIAFGVGVAQVWAVTLIVVILVAAAVLAVVFFRR